MYHLRSNSGSNGPIAKECHRFLVAGPFKLFEISTSAKLLSVGMLSTGRYFPLSPTGTPTPVMKSQPGRADLPMPLPRVMSRSAEALPISLYRRFSSSCELAA